MRHNKEEEDWLKRLGTSLLNGRAQDPGESAQTLQACGQNTPWAQRGRGPRRLADLAAHRCLPGSRWSAQRPGPRGECSRLLPRLNVRPGHAEPEKSRREQRACGEQSRGGGEDGTVARATAATSDTAVAGSSQPRKLRALPSHPPPASSLRPPERVTADAGQSEAWSGPSADRIREGGVERETREARTAAGLPVTDSMARPMGSEEMTSSPRESGSGRAAARRWEEMDDQSEAGRWSLKAAAVHWSPCQDKGGGPGWTSPSCQGSRPSREFRLH
nr:bcl-2-binding component 3, isoforms 3/4-like [Dasypus novemcinctus]